MVQIESGLLVFKLISCELTKASCHLEVLMDDMVFPAYSGAKIKSRVTEINDSKLSRLPLARGFTNLKV